MSYVTPPELGFRIEGFVGAPAPKLPNTSVWVWFCCSCAHANQRPRETETYSVCRACQHERCRGCHIRWKARTISQEYSKRAVDRTMAFADGKYSPTTYYRLKQEDEDDAAKHGLETRWGRMARERREREEMHALAEKLVEEEDAAERATRAAGGGRIRRIGGVLSVEVIGGSESDSRDSASGESVKGEVDNVGRIVEKLAI